MKCRRYFLYHKDMKESKRLKVFLNGVRADKCIVADVRYGFAIVLAEKDGKPLMDGDSFLYKVKYGKVEIEKKGEKEC